jgi:GAF domain-containing protein
LKRDLTEALARESATGEILRMVRDSPANEQAVFEAIVSSAWRLLSGFGGAFGGAVYRVVGEELHLAAYVSTNPTGDAALRSTFPRPLAFFSPPGEAIRGRAPVVLTDVDTDEWVPDDIRELIRKRGDRSGVWVPMMREGVALGAIGVTRSEPGSFGDEQISLLKTFADQAVIAIENVRLFKELREKNRALTHAHAQVTESLEQQTATSDILRVISSSPTDVQPVFDTIVRSAVRLCAGLFSALYQFDGELLHRVAQHNYTPEALEELYRVFPARPTRALFTGRAILARAVVHIPDSEVDPGHQHRALRRAIGWRSGLFVPMLREGAPIGVIEVARAEPGSFSDSEIALLETFADQAVIAIENVRLFTELQEKNGALTQAHAQVSESLEQRTATSEILRVISSSPTDVQPVFDSIAESAARLCDANDAEIYRVDGDVYRRVAHRGPVPIAGPLGEAYPISRGRPSSRAIIDRQTIHVHDQAAEIDSEFPDLKAWQPVAGVRTILATPMLRDGVALGVIVLRRTEVNPFSGKHIELLKTFADQAVIAIENVRLFTELEARNRDLAGALQRETATGEILRLISSSPTDVTPVFDGILRSAVRLAAADYGATLILDGEFLHLAASHGTTREWQKVAEHVYPLRVGPDSASGQAILERRAVFIEDAQASPLARVRDLARTMGYRSQLMVPMLRRDAAIGVLALVWQEAPEFPSGQLSLLQTFADQGVIAIENVRLFKELQ